MFDLFDFMPVKASSWAATVDWINNLITFISVICIIGITGVMIFFAIRYHRRSEDQKTAFVTHNLAIETVWTVVPTIIIIYIFYYGLVVYQDMRNPPANALEVTATGRKWSWSYQYTNGKKSSELVVPLGKPIRLVMTSDDVIHSLFIPAMRVKEDVRNGEYSYLWFEPIKKGVYHIFCAEYCGTKHSAMTSKLRVVSPEEFEDFLNDRTAIELPPAEKGKQLFKLNGCDGCHSIDGTAGIGPSLKGIVKQGERKLADGKAVNIDENYIRESILNPNAKIVIGFKPQLMPPFEGKLSEEEMLQLIAYLKTL